MPKILILASISKAFYNFSFELLEQLIGEKYEVTLSIPEDPVNREFERIGCRVIPAPLNRHGMNPLAELRLLREYRRLCREVRPDVIFTFTIKPNTYGGITARSLGIPYLASVTGLGTVFFNRKPVNRVIRAMLKYGLGKARCIFFQNRANLELFRAHGMLQCRVHMIPGSGVNLKKRGVLPYPAGDGKIRFLMEARASREKGVAEYLYAARKIRETHPECEFHYAGFTEEPEYEAMLRQAHEAGTILYHGFLDNAAVETLMRSIHAVVLPSYHEGMSNVLLEGAAYGRPLLTGDVPGCRETVETEQSGFLFRPQSGEAVAEAVEKFLHCSPEQRRTMGLAGRRLVEERFDREFTIAAYLEEIRAAVTGNAATHPSPAQPE